MEPHVTAKKGQSQAAKDLHEIAANIHRVAGAMVTPAIPDTAQQAKLLETQAANLRNIAANL